MNPYKMNVPLRDVADLASGTWFSLGIEEELMIVDPATRELRSFIEQILEDGKIILHEHVKPEMHQSVVELGTGICRDIAEARRDVTHLRKVITDVARKQGLAVAAAGTHPFSHWVDQKITENPRYKVLIEDMQMVAQENLIFGLHVHVGIPDKETGIQVMNAIRYFLPHIFALSTNSPFWLGRDTGLRSYRSKVFDRFPRTGLPDHFNSYAEFDAYVNMLIKTHCIDDAKKIWWDVRLHPHFQTLEVRICDIPLRVDETIALAALIQAVTAKLYLLFRLNMGFRLYRRIYLNENRWRAARYGINGKMIDFGKQTEVPIRDLVLELLGFVDDVVDDLNSRSEIGYITKIMEMGTGADRQLQVFKETGDLKRVVDYIIEETHFGLAESE